MNLQTLDDSSNKNMPPIPVSRFKYGNKFIAILDNRIIATGNTHLEARHKVRKLVQPKDRMRVEYYFIARRSNFYRSTGLNLLAFILLNIQLFIGIEAHIVDRISILVFFDITIFALFIALNTMINPVIRSQSDVYGFLGESIKRQERQLGWEVARITTSAYLLILSILAQLWFMAEFKFVLNQFSYLTLIIAAIIPVHFWLVVREDKKLKILHNYLIDTITIDDQLTYDQIVDYLQAIPAFKNLQATPDRNVLLTMLEASIESPFSITKVIVFRILVRDLEIVLAAIIVPFIIAYNIFTDRYNARVFGSFVASLLLLAYGLIKKHSSDQWTSNYIKNHPTFTLRSGGIDRIYLKFFPYEVNKLKEETVLTILKQSITLTRGLGFAFLFYFILALMLSLINLPLDIRSYLESFLLIGAVFPTSVYITFVARNGTKNWVNSVEKSIQNLDAKLKNSLGFTPMDIAYYLRSAREIRENMRRNSSNYG